MRAFILLWPLTLALACGGESSTSAQTSPPPPVAVVRAPVVVTAWAAEPATVPSLQRAVTVLLTTTCVVHAPHVVVRLRGRSDASGRVEWMADDAPDAELSRCLWDPLLRPTIGAAADFDVRVALGGPAVTELPAVGPIAASSDWTGLSCRHRTAASCPEGHTCPQSVWAEAPCPP